MAEKIPGSLQRVLMLQISEIKGELKGFDTRFQGPDAKVEARLGGLEAKIGGEFKAVHSEISRLDQKIDSVDAKSARESMRWTRD